MTSFSSFDPLHVGSFGDNGRETARTMNKAVQEHNLGLGFNSESKQFTVLNSSSMSKESVQDIFDKHNYNRWKPMVTDETDKEGNFQVRLKAISHFPLRGKPLFNS